MSRCEDKRRYSTEKKARRALQRIQARRQRLTGGIVNSEQQAYPCACGGWHLTSSPPLKKRAA